MHLGNQKQLSPPSRPSRHPVLFRLALLLILPFYLLSSTPTLGESYASVPEVANLMAVITALNLVMRAAAANPMNLTPRVQIIAAMGMMGAADAGVAQAFKEGRLNDSDLPGLQKMLGSFVNVNAADAFKSFLKNPRMDLIPHTGPNFPKVAPAALPKVTPAQIAALTGKAGTSGPSQSLGQAQANSDQVVNLAGTASTGFSYKDGASKNSSVLSSGSGGSAPVSTGYAYKSGSTPSSASGANGGAVAAASAAAGSPSLPDSFASASDTSAVGTVGQTAAAASSASQMDSNLQPSLNISNASGTRAPQLETPLMREAASDLSNLEKGNASASDRTISSVATMAGNQGNLASSEDDGDAPAENSKTVKKAHGRHSSTKMVKHRQAASLNSSSSLSSPSKPTAFSTEKFNLSIKAKYWRVTPFLHVADMFFPSQFAHAEGGEEGGGGSAGAQQFQALAFMMMGLASALAPIAIAAIQSNNDYNITVANDQTQMALANIAAGNAAYMANLQASIAQQQTQAAFAMNNVNNQFQSQRLQMQLAQLQQARNDALQADREKRAIEYQFNQERIGLAEQQAQNNVNLAKQTLAANLTAAGFAQGYSGSINSGSGLAVNSVLFGAPPGAGGIPPGAMPSNIAGANGMAATGASGSSVDPGTFGSSTGSSGLGSLASLTSASPNTTASARQLIPTQYTGISPARSSALLAAVRPTQGQGQTAPPGGMVQLQPLKAAIKVSGPPQTTAYSYASYASRSARIALPRGLQQAMTNCVVSGSSAAQHCGAPSLSSRSTANNSGFGQFYANFRQRIQAREMDSQRGNAAAYQNWSRQMFSGSGWNTQTSSSNFGSSSMGASNFRGMTLGGHR